MSSPVPGSTLTSSTITFEGGHTTSDVSHALWIGTTPGGRNLSSGSFWEHRGTVAGLLSSGTIYVRYWSTNGDSSANSSWDFRDLRTR